MSPLLVVSFILLLHINVGQTAICQTPGSTQIRSTVVESQSGSYVSLPCNGVRRVGFVLSVTWKRTICRIHTTPLIPPHNSRTATVLQYQSNGSKPPSDKRFTFEPFTFALKIVGVTTGDSGQYFCHVNEADTPLSSVHLQVKGAAEAPGRPIVISFTSRAANVSWTQPKQDNFSPVLHYTVHVRESEARIWRRTVRTSRNLTQLSVENLKPYTVYSFSVAAVNDFGAGRISLPSYPIQTLRERPSSSVSQLRVTARASRHLQLSWQPASIGTLHGEFLGYLLVYNTSHTASAHLVITDKNVTSLRITGLDPRTKYQFVMSIKNPEGTGPSVSVIESTLPAVPDQPASMNVVQLGSTWVKISWQPPLKTNSVIENYVIRVASESSSKSITLPDSKQQTYHYLVERLVPFTVYNISVGANSEIGPGLSKSVRFRTDTIAPHRPILLSVTCLGPESVAVEWQGQEKSEPKVAFYVVAYRNARWRKYRHLSVVATDEPYMKQLSALGSGVVYVKVQAVRKGVYDGTLHKSHFTDNWSVLMPSTKAGCEGFQVVWPSGMDSSVSTVVSTITSLVILVCLLAFVFILRRKCRLSTNSSSSKCQASEC